ncbi:hypothetical protein DWQ65_07135 [Treponema phagedenis]|uniref:Uncharacterized protein n=1 Tax=Treponema phagedenis TaxID=162 RepID=A0A0B7GYB4_TREPH|nr:hypothetical protein [Treponema phagedenis]NVP25398.1 hypothetical protein [Treponema phagedenis]QEK00791.1 hypothetical protein FUT84_06145 [Treponema phagedenis]QEK05798.1 hypothetical protein FUT80_03060 [Treponema phagedenis]QKS92172.1 hypothetical protein HPJ96_06090 [Treponema phagedenis]QLC57523.1 hypothetical protein HW453_00825 [Treponema phagedenis]
MKQILNILAGYKTILLGVCKFLLIAGGCLVIGFVIVYPLWWLATTMPKTYTVITLGIFGIILLYTISKKLIRSYKKNPRRLLLILLKNFVLIVWLFFTSYLVLLQQRLFALLFFLLLIGIYGFLAFGISEKEPIQSI